MLQAQSFWGVIRVCVKIAREDFLLAHLLWEAAGEVVGHCWVCWAGCNRLLWQHLLLWGWLLGKLLHWLLRLQDLLGWLLHGHGQLGGHGSWLLRQGLLCNWLQGLLCSWDLRRACSWDARDRLLGGSCRGLVSHRRAGCKRGLWVGCPRTGGGRRGRCDHRGWLQDRELGGWQGGVFHRLLGACWCCEDVECQLQELHGGLPSGGL